MKRAALLAAGMSLLSFACTGLLGDFNMDGGASDAAPSGSSSGGDSSAGSSSGSSSSGSSGSGGSTDASMDRVSDGPLGSDVDASIVDAHDGSVESGPPPTVSVTAGDQTAYVFQTVALSATATVSNGSAATFAWSLTSAPTGSTFTTNGIVGAATANATFIPDVAGDYAFSVGATASGVRGSASVTAHAVASTVFYMRGDLYDAGAEAASMFTSAYYASGSDGTQVHPVTCPVTGGTQSGFLSPAPQTLQFWAPGDLADFWEAPPGHPSQFAVSIYNADSTGTPLLFVGSADASCASPPTSIYYDGGAFQPRFSPDGSRIAFVAATDFSIVTVNPDGSDLRVVSAYAAGLADSGLSFDFDTPGLNFPPRPQWLGSTVAWVRQTTTSDQPAAWEIVTANDVPGAMPQRYMACPGGTPREFAFLADGSVVVAYRPNFGTSANTSGPENLYRLAAGTGLNCTIVKQYTDLGNSGISQASDFAVSPDGTQIAFVQVDGITDDASVTAAGFGGGYPYVVLVDGGTPVRLSSDFFLFGPRWVAGGSRLASVRYDSFTDGGLVQFGTSIIVRSPAAGPSPPPLVQTDGYTAFVSTGQNGGCDVAPGTTPPAGAFIGMIAAAFARVFRRRDRRRC
jgi:hypothetical protein